MIIKMVKKKKKNSNELKTVTLVAIHHEVYLINYPAYLPQTANLPGNLPETAYPQLISHRHTWAVKSRITAE